MYHLQSNKITTANPGRTSINTTINRADPAGIVAALICEHTKIATDSAGAKLLETIIHHIQQCEHTKIATDSADAKLLETIIHHIQQSIGTIHFYLVKRMLVS